VTDEYLLAALRLAAGVDPVPGGVSADARTVFSLRLPGGIVARPQEVTAPPGARSVHDGPAILRFVSEQLTMDLEMAVVEGRLEIAGQVSPAPGPDPWVEIRTPRIREVRVPSESGQFAAADLPPGWISVVCHRPEQAPVATSWFQARD
jgi:hypothetical protein